MFKLSTVYIGVLLITILCGVGNAAVNSKLQDPQQQITDFSLSGFGERGKKSWDVSGKSADMSSEIVQLTDIVSNLYGENEDIRLTAQRGSFDKKEGILHLKDDVVISTSSGTKLTTNSLDWDRKNQVVQTQDMVNIARENIVTKATGAAGHPNLSKLSLEKDVQVEINPSRDPADTQKAVKDKITINCDGPLEIDYKSNVGVFNNNVKVETTDVLIYSDHMDVYFAKTQPQPKEGQEAHASLMSTQIDKIVARGNVRIVRGDNVAYSEEAVYTAKDKKVTLSGQPKLVIYSTEDLSHASAGN
ncbi:MAG: LPS export ABC transporter periplasmic protein LptC [Candidatus Omnitrophota bacterium]|jgi:LPS export ABC transporter protein LptC|nr:MAG: LPS export ABC transporter periplasmic protein LptC [Candidatus Omnitrophota bacterium]